jgi:phage baseplate assembly protein W
MAKSNTITTTYSDFNVNFNVNPITGDLLKVTGTNSVVQSLMNLVQINYFEKPFHPEIGSNIRGLLFEQMDPLTSNALSKEIKVLVENFEPRVSINNVIVQADYDKNGYNIEIDFEILSVNNTFTISTFLQRLS